MICSLVKFGPQSLHFGLILPRLHLLLLGVIPRLGLVLRLLHLLLLRLRLLELRLRPRLLLERV